MISDKYFICYNDNSYVSLSVIIVIITISLVKAITVVQLKWQDFNSLFCKRNITYEPCYIDSYSNSTNMPIVKFFIVHHTFILIYITTTPRAKRTHLGARVKVGVSLAPSWCPGTKKVGAKFRTWPWSRWVVKNRNLEDSIICTPLGGLFEKKYLTEVVCTTDGDTLKVFNFIQINMGAGARPILAIWTIWRPQWGSFNACLLNRSCLYYWKGHPEGVQLHPDHHGSRRQVNLGYLDHLEAPERHSQCMFTK